MIPSNQQLDDLEAAFQSARSSTDIIPDHTILPEILTLEDMTTTRQSYINHPAFMDLVQASERISRLKNGLENMMRDIQLQKAQIHNSLSLIQILPHEIMDLIFLAGVRMEFETGSSFSSSILMVSKSWRQHALEQRELWTYIWAQPHRRIRPLQWYLEKTGSAPLHIISGVSDPNDGYALWASPLYIALREFDDARRLSGTSSRWKSLWIGVHPLEPLERHFLSEKSYTGEGVAPALFDWLQRCSRLESLSLVCGKLLARDLSHFDSHHSPEKFIVMPFLKRLSCKFTSDYDATLWFIFKYIRAPLLEILEIFPMVHQRMLGAVSPERCFTDLGEFLYRSPGLRSITVTGRTDFSSSLLKSLAAEYQATHLRINSSSSLFLPRLEEVAIDLEPINLSASSLPIYSFFSEIREALLQFLEWRRTALLREQSYNSASSLNIPPALHTLILAHVPSIDREWVTSLVVKLEVTGKLDEV